MFHGAKAWVADFKHEHYEAAKKAMVKGFLLNETSFDFQ